MNTKIKKLSLCVLALLTGATITARDKDPPNKITMEG